jgi:hypothetical protein
MECLLPIGHGMLVLWPEVTIYNALMIYMNDYTNLQGLIPNTLQSHEVNLTASSLLPVISFPFD